MITKHHLLIAALLGATVSACSNNPQEKTKAATSAPEPIPEAGELLSKSQADQPKIAKALDLRYIAPTSKPVQPVQRYPIPQAQPMMPQAQAQTFASVRPSVQRPMQVAMARPSVPPANTSMYLRPRAQPQTTGMPRLSKAELTAIGQQIFVNEGGGNMKRLVHWNVGEDFASMGIGHFTWYPSGRRQSFGNTFPGLLDYMSQQGVQMPEWLKRARHSGAPWRSRTELLRDSDSAQVRELQQLLYRTRDIQAEYIVNRARRAMPRLVKAANTQMQDRVAQNLNAVANTSGGWYALIDYVNFKGEGLSSGGYKGQNWGLRQVLEEMRPSRPGQQALHEFADAALRVLQRRVRNSDPSRNEKRWLPGWKNRVDTYRNPIV